MCPASIRETRNAPFPTTDDLQREYDRLAGLGVTFNMPLTKEAGGSIATVNDTCGNLIQLTQLSWQG